MAPFTDMDRTLRSASKAFNYLTGDPERELRKRGMYKTGLYGSQFRNSAEVKRYYKRMKRTQRRREVSQDPLNEDLIRLMREAKVIPIDFVP